MRDKTDHIEIVQQGEDWHWKRRDTQNKVVAESPILFPNQETASRAARRYNADLREMVQDEAEPPAEPPQQAEPQPEQVEQT
jgi:hypothetical protein